MMHNQGGTNLYSLNIFSVSLPILLNPFRLGGCARFAPLFDPSDVMPIFFSRLTELLAAVASRILFRRVAAVAPRKRLPARRSGRYSLEQLERREVFNATYHGGALLTHVEAQPIFLGQTWSSNTTLISEAASIDNFVQYLVKSPYM